MHLGVEAVVAVVVAILVVVAGSSSIIVVVVVVVVLQYNAETGAMTKDLKHKCNHTYRLAYIHTDIPGQEVLETDPTTIGAAVAASTTAASPTLTTAAIATSYCCY